MAMIMSEDVKLPASANFAILLRHVDPGSGKVEPRHAVCIYFPYCPNSHFASMLIA